MKLSRQEQETVREAILSKAGDLGQKIYGIVGCSNHVHIVAQRTSESIEMIVSYYKNAARLALRSRGFAGRVWTKGLDKRFCYEPKQLESRIEYLRRHPQEPVYC